MRSVKVTRTIVTVLGMILLLSYGSAIFAASSETLLTQSLELLQKGEKAKALRLLEQAFNKAQDPETVKEAAVLIIEASPMNYPKRESFLKYLVQYHRDHEDRWKWMQELGDIAFNRADLSSAEDYQLQAVQIAPHPGPIRYKLAWTLWNQKRKNEAFLIFLDLLSAESASDISTSLTRDLAKLWWDTGVLPIATLKRFLTLNESARKQVITELWSLFPKTQFGDSTLRSMLHQIRDEPGMSDAWNEFLSLNLTLTKDPCFLITTIYREQDFAPEDVLLNCSRAKDRPEFSQLERHFQHLLPQASEALLRLYASLLHESGRSIESLRVLTDWSNFLDAPADYRKLCGELALSLPANDFIGFASQLPAEKWEAILVSMPQKKDLLLRLQAVDSDRWIAYEEKSYGDNVPREFLLKKAELLAARQGASTEEVRAIVLPILEKPTSPEEKAAASTLKSLDLHTQTEIPRIFDDKFLKELDLWISSIDRDLQQYERLGARWKLLTRELVIEKVKANVQQIVSQLEQVNLPEDQHELESEFLAKRADLKEMILNKYSSLGSL